MDSKIFCVLRSIGLPGLMSREDSVKSSPEYLQIAKINKIPLFYLESLSDTERNQFKSQYDAFRMRHEKVVRSIAYVSEVFEKSHVNYSFFKTIKPFSYLPSDVDVLINSAGDFSRALRALTKVGFVKMAEDSFSTTMKNLERDSFLLDVDLQLAPSVANIPYINTAMLFDHVIEKRNGNALIKTLDANADIIVAASHSFYKEHMFTLSDYYTIALLSSNVSPSDLFDLSLRTKTTLSVFTTFTLVNQITKVAFGRKLENVENIIKKIGEPLTANCYLQKSIDVPFKFSQIWSFLALMNKVIEDPLPRSSILKAFYNSMSTDQLDKLLKHFIRETY